LRTVKLWHSPSNNPYSRLLMPALVWVVTPILFNGTEWNILSSWIIVLPMMLSMQCSLGQAPLKLPRFSLADQ